MRARYLVAASIAGLLCGTMFASAQNSPGSAQQDRGIREDAGKPAVKGPPATEQGQSKGRTSGSVGQGQSGPSGQPEAPGGRYQDEKNNEEIGKPPTGGK